MASPLTELLGDKVATKDGSGVDVNSFQGEGKVRPSAGVTRIVARY